MASPRKPPSSVPLRVNETFELFVDETAPMMILDALYCKCQFCPSKKMRPVPKWEQHIQELALRASYYWYGGRTKICLKAKSGDFLIEILSSSQTKNHSQRNKTLLDIPISVTPHKSLNSVRGVISEPDLLKYIRFDTLDVPMATQPFQKNASSLRLFVVVVVIDTTAEGAEVRILTALTAPKATD
ncbi:hypothetical protein HNY73_007476 [Argiope bruennichi]|uniref:Uncharacterized protein n=1 Tax=Argiope bruennichi TaxID=94029 RepID=A0A8T0FGL9_ARGBR|nr:hypothetical protein HNY73_007476 [Argiope bruennichi]